MRLHRACLLTAAILVLAAASGCKPKTTLPLPLSDADTAKLAEQTFLENTDHEIKSYSVSLPRQVDGTTQFNIDGVAAFDRPGNHWIVKVDKATGKTDIDEAR